MKANSDSSSGALRSKSNDSQGVFTIDIFSKGAAFGQQKINAHQDPRDYFALRLKDDTEMVRLKSHYMLHKNNPVHELELHLMRLLKQGQLSSSTIYLGTTTDPFFPFEGKFDSSMKLLALFERYAPAKLIVQTRSPLIVIAMPVLKKLGRRASVTIGIETPDEDVVRKYTPGLPRICDRLQAARALRRFGVDVTLQVAPLLPYGDWKKDCSSFATLLIENSDHIYVRPMTDGSEAEERKLKSSPLYRALANDRKFHWLRPDAANPLITTLEVLAPNKLKVLKPERVEERQLSMFAA